MSNSSCCEASQGFSIYRKDLKKSYAKSKAGLLWNGILLFLMLFVPDSPAIGGGAAEKSRLIAGHHRAWFTRTRNVVTWPRYQDRVACGDSEGVEN
jgi:hypothetical protein